MPQPKRLETYPRERLIPHELARGRAREVDLLERLGAPTSESELMDDERRYFWDLVWPCGLITALGLGQLSEVLSVRLDAPELDHALRHLGVEVGELWIWQNEDPELYLQMVEPVDRSWSLWHLGDDGGRVCVASGLTHRDATCWLACELDQPEEGSEPRWWIDQLRTFPGAAPLPSRAAGPETSL